MARYAAAAALLVIAFVAGYAIDRPWFEVVRFVTCSPDSVFRLEAVKTEWPSFSMPGHGGDGGGYIRLIDNYSRRVIQQSPHLPLVSSFFKNSYFWRDFEVEVKLDAKDTITEYWPLRRSTFSRSSQGSSRRCLEAEPFAGRLQMSLRPS